MVAIAKRRGGQAMVLFLGFAAVMVAMLLVAFNSGQVTNAKMRAMNAADAAAYSGALWQARNLNFQAYMNRAIVVNEVTIAQSVSLRSWVAYVDRFVANVSILANFFLPVGAAVRAVERVIDAADRALQQALPVAEAGIRVLGNIEHSAQVVFDNAAPLAAQDLASSMAQANGARVSIGGTALIADNLRTWTAFTETYSPGRTRMGNNDRRVRLRDVILDSRDGFTQARDWRLEPLIPYTAELRKQGGTDLIDYDTWKGLDGLQFRTQWNFVKNKWDTKVAVGWGGGQAYAPNRQTGIGRHGDYNEWSDSDGQRARSMANDNTHRHQMPSRMPGYRDLSAAQRNPPAGQRDRDPRLPFSVEVVIRDEAIATSGGAAMQARVATRRGAVLDMDPQYASRDPGVFALAEACVGFERPYGADRRDGLTEKPSLFNPYWRAFMATPSSRSRTIVDGAKGLAPVRGLIGGSGSCET
jgi:hypothetical protein